MALSLRIVIGVALAVIVAVVASLTLAITYTVSVAAARDAGERLSEAIAATVAFETESFLGQAESHLFAIRNMTKLESTVRPEDDPLYPAGEGWGLRWMYSLRSFQLDVNYTYSSATIILDDGSIIVNLDHQLSPGWAYEGVTTNRRYPNGTQYRTRFQQAWRINGGRAWDTAVDGQQVELSRDVNQSDTAGYQSLKLLTGGQERCMWFAPAVDNNGLEPRYILYGLCTLYNRTNHLIGQVSIGRFMDELPRFLQGTSKTDNTQLFIIDNNKLLVGTTHPSNPIEFGEPGVLRQRDNCVSSAALDTNTAVKIGCRAKAADFPYAPLQEVVSGDGEFIRAPGKTVKFGKLDGENYYYISQRIPSGLEAYSMNLVLFMPESDVLGNVVQGRNVAIGVTVAVFVVAAVVSFIMVGVLLRPVDDVAKRMYFTSKLTSEKEANDMASRRDVNTEGDEVDLMTLYAQEDMDDEPLSRSGLAEVRALQTAYTTMDTAIRSFTKYVPRDVVKELMATNQMCEIQMRPMRCSMLFTDIAGFTSICERVPPPVLSSLIRLYFERSSRIVMGHGGVIDKFIGDCIMAVWGAPVPIDHHEVRSSVCAHMLVYETQQDPLRSEFAAANEVLAIRAGVATGEVLAGNMGSQARMNYTVIGDDVNLASRLEGLNKQWGTSVMVSEETAEECAEYLVLRYVISIAVVGKEQPVKVYEVIGVDPEADTQVLGRVTSEASENISLAQAQNDEDQREMEERYGVKNVKSDGPTVLSAGKLLRRALRKVQVAPEEKVFASVYGEAIQLWNRGDFAGCLSTLRSLGERVDVPRGCGERLSVQKVLVACEENLKAPPAGQWTGVWVANEK